MIRKPSTYTQHPYSHLRYDVNYHCLHPQEMLDCHFRNCKFSKSELADILNLSVSHFCNIVNGKKRPAVDVLVKLALIFNLNNIVAEYWIKGFGYELDCRMTTYQRFRLLLQNSWRNKIIDPNDDPETIVYMVNCFAENAFEELFKRVGEDKKEHIKALNQEVVDITSMADYDFQKFLQSHNYGKSASGKIRGVEYYDITNVTFSNHCSDSESVIKRETLLKYVDNLRLETCDDLAKLFGIAGYYIFSNFPGDREIFFAAIDLLKATNHK